MNTVVNVVTNIFRIYLDRRFIQILTGGKQEKRWKELLAGTIFFLLNTGMYLTFHLAWVNVVTSIVGISLLASLYTKSIRKNLFVNGVILLIAMACDTVVVSLLADYQDGEELNQIFSVISVLLFFVSVMIAEKLLTHRDKTDSVKNMPLVLVPLCSVVIVVYMVLHLRKPDTELMVVSIGLLVVNFLIIYLYNMLAQAYAHKYENDMLKHQIEVYANQLDITLQSEDKIRSLRHDMKHHMNELKLLAGKGDTHSIENYIDRMSEFLQNPDEIVASGNMEIDSVLNYMLHKANEKQIKTEVKVQIPENMKHSFDLNIILGNLLENAIEAAVQTEEKQLRVAISFRQEILRIEIVNSYTGILKCEKDTLLTTKEDKESHGIGLQSVRKIVEKYNGVLKLMPYNGMFCASLILYMSKLENK